MHLSKTINKLAAGKKDDKTNNWKTIGVRVRNSELPLVNKELEKLGFTTLGDLAKDLIAGKITRLTDQ